jgi:hypothetical protein
MKYTLLELTQSVLSSMDSDEINSINDTVESQQVVEVIKTVYDDIISRGDLESNKAPFNLTPSGDPLKPVLMTKPENIDHVHWVKYNCMDSDDTDPVWRDMTYLPFMDFIDYMHQYHPTETDMSSFDFIADGFVTTFTYKTDTAPSYYTTFNDNTVIFDAHDVSIDTTLQSSKTLCYGSKTTDFLAQDTFIPSLQPKQFPLLLNEAKSLAWAELKQTAHQKAEITAHRNWRHLQKSRQNIPDGQTPMSGAHSFDKLPNFSRRR